MISTSNAATVTTSISGGRTVTGSPSSFWSVAVVDKNWPVRKNAVNTYATAEIARMGKGVGTRPEDQS